MASRLRVLYVGVTSKLVARVWDHKQKKVAGFTQKYHCDSLVYYETFGEVRAAIAREKQIKSWRREKKLNLIERMNPDWKDMSEGWFPVIPALQKPNP
jgi:putative endonuclease